MTSMRFHRDLTVQTLIDTWPSTREVFIRRRMACVGCELAPFMTIVDAAIAYEIPPDDLERELHEAATQPAASPAAGTSLSNAAIRTPESNQ